MNLEELKTELNSAADALQRAEQLIRELLKRNETQKKVIDQQKQAIKRMEYDRMSNYRRSF